MQNYGVEITVARPIDGRVLLRVLLVALTLAFVRVGIWFLSMAATGEASWAQRGLLAPFLFATLAVLAIGATFGRPPTLTRSERFMAQVRQRSQRNDHQYATVLFVLVTSAVEVGLFIWSFSF